MIKRLLILPIVLLMTLISCKTSETLTISVPLYPLARPTRPVLDTVPQSTSEALRVLVSNMNKLISYTEELEIHITAMDNYYGAVLDITIR